MTTTEKVEFMLDAVRVLQQALDAVVGTRTRAQVSVHQFEDDGTYMSNVDLAACLRDMGGEQFTSGDTTWFKHGGVTVFFTNELLPEQELDDIPF